MKGEVEEKAAPRRRMSAAERREVIERAAAEVFAERGYQGASIDEIARRSGVSPPVFYDHFSSKEELHRRLLERHYAELRQVWRENLAGEGGPEERIARAFDAWFAYVEANPIAARLLFRDTSGNAEVEARRQQVAAESRAAIIGLLAREGGEEVAAGPSEDALGMAWEVLRGVLQGLALWWDEHPHVPREQVVATAMNAIWIGLERVRGGEVWLPGGGLAQLDQPG